MVLKVNADHLAKVQHSAGKSWIELTQTIHMGCAGSWIPFKHPMTPPPTVFYFVALRFSAISHRVKIFNQDPSQQGLGLMCDRAHMVFPPESLSVEASRS